MSNNAKIVRDYYKNNLTLFTDRIFREVATNKDFVTEILRVFLEDEKLEIIELIPQRDISIYNQRRVILDVYCKLSSGKVVNVEVENDTYGEKHNHQKRVRYYGAITKMKEEKLMPVEVEKAIEGLREEGRLEGIQEGRIKGIQEGKLEGELKTFVSLLRQGIISEEVVLKNLNISKEELEKKIREFAI